MSDAYKTGTPGPWTTRVDLVDGPPEHPLFLKKNFFEVVLAVTEVDRATTKRLYNCQVCSIMLLLSQYFFDSAHHSTFIIILSPPFSHPVTQTSAR